MKVLLDFGIRSSRKNLGCAEFTQRTVPLPLCECGRPDWRSRRKHPQRTSVSESLELEQRTHDRIRPLPLAEEISHHARQELVRRLDSYELEHNDLFVRIVDLIRDRFVPIITRHALSGRAHVNTEKEIFQDPLAISMLIDVFSERGFHAVVISIFVKFRSDSTCRR